MPPLKKARESKTIRDFSWGSACGLALVLLWGVPAILVEGGVLRSNPIPDEVLWGGLPMLGLSAWAIRRRFQTETKIWR